VTGRRYRYAETRQLSQRFASSLRRAGLQPGDTLIIVMPNTAEWPIVLLGAMEAGLLVSTANPSSTRGKYTDTGRITVGRYG
jgi:long-chain acyl-CoA synthetase